MAKSRTGHGHSASDHQVSILELTLVLNSRGRSVIHGTLVVDGEMRTYKAEIDSKTRESLEKDFIPLLPYFPGATTGDRPTS
jgi:hypothetical protein